MQIRRGTSQCRNSWAFQTKIILQLNIVHYYSLNCNIHLWLSKNKWNCWWFGKYCSMLLHYVLSLLSVLHQISPRNQVCHSLFPFFVRIVNVFDQTAEIRKVDHCASSEENSFLTAWNFDALEWIINRFFVSYTF